MEDRAEIIELETAALDLGDPSALTPLDFDTIAAEYPFLQLSRTTTCHTDFGSYPSYSLSNIGH